MIVETRERDPQVRNRLVAEISTGARAHFGIDVFIELAKPRTLRRTSSGKLSRSQNKTAFLARTSAATLRQPQGIAHAQANA